jgi:UDP-3-O-[3-hydroxymyristoyl] glucosamine N-acyltransferase
MVETDYTRRISLKLRDIAAQLHCRLEGDGDLDIVRVAPIQQAQPGDLTFVASARYLPDLKTTRASAVILGKSSAGDPAAPCAVLKADDPYSAFAHAVSLFAPEARPAPGIDPLSAVAADASIGPDVSIGPFVTVGAGAIVGARTVLYPGVVIGPGARVGDDCVIRSQVSIRERAVIGNRVTLHDGVVVGSDGFGFAPQKDGTHLKIPQHADIVIEDDVEIGANSTIDRPAIGETRIRAGTKIDNLVHIAHGVSIGRRALLAAQVGIAGSTIVDDDVMVAGQSGVAGHLRVGARAKIGAKSAVLQSVDAGSFVTGHPAFDHTDWRKASVVFRQLPWLKKRVEELEQRIAELEEKLAACPPADR